MSEVSPFAELLGHAFFHFERMKPLLPTYGHLLVSALFPMYIGAHASLSRPASAAKPPKKATEDECYDTDDDEAEDEQNSVQKMEGLEPSDALMLPLTAGLTLGGLYLVIKWLEDPAILNKILSFYFSQVGVFFAIAFLKDALLILRSFALPRSYRYGGKTWKAKQSERKFIAQDANDSKRREQVRRSPLPGVLGSIPLPEKLITALWICRSVVYQRLKLRLHIRGLLDAKALVGLLDILSGILALCAVGYFAFVTKPWWLTNFLGFSFCYGALQFMSPSTFWTGTLILGSLFFYDIYFVFFTPLMVTVATKLDVPIKLLFPRPPSPTEEPDTLSLAMLGLGDIVVPGMMVGLALRFDLFLYYYRKGSQRARAEGSKEEIIKAQYQSATGAWGERFWAPPIMSQEPEHHPPYYDARSFPKTYFKASLVGYVCGMIATLLAMQYSDHAQPALLYLVPGVLLSLWGTAFFRGEIRTMWEFSDAEEEENSEAKDGESDKNHDDKSHEHKSLIMRLWSGDLKTLTKSTKSTDESASQGGALEKTKDSSERSDETARDDKPHKPKSDKGEEGETKDDSDLFLFSVSFPRKSRAKLKLDMTDGTDMVFIPGVGEHEDEPPPKRRRGIPRKTVMS